MKKSVKITLLIFGIILTALIIISIYCISVGFGVKVDENKLISTEKGITYYDVNDNEIETKNGDRTVTKIEEIPLTLINAFISIEDKRFYEHNGIDFKGILRASVNNIKNFSFKQGGSTITQQLVKNTHLSGEKTLKRKILEFKLAKKIEKKYSKEEILEKYLNTIYFGENCYGITSACKHYFDKKPIELTLNECAVLAGIVKAPSLYSPNKNATQCNTRKNLVLKSMLNLGYISDIDCQSAVNEDIKTVKPDVSYDFLYLAQNEVENILKNNDEYQYQKIKVYTTLNSNLQEMILENFKTDSEYDKSVIITDKNNNVSAYFSTTGEIRRNLGSTIKPLLCYAPSIEENTVYSCTKIVDEKTDFNGFSPSNYKEKYRGNISVKKSLEVSSNICAVKLLNYTGINNCLKYLNKTEIETTDNDNNLSIALGSTEKGATLKEIACSYNVFLNNGTLIQSSCIRKIEIENVTIDKSMKKNTKIFSNSTIDIINDMLYGVTENGTSKKLSFCNAKIYAKTGTAGNKNGNTDAYCISYNPEYVVGVWHGKAEGGIIDNTITGGNQPTVIAYNIWQKIYAKKTNLDFDYNDIVYKDIDKTEYDESGNIILCDDNCPNRLKLNEIFKKDYYPNEKSTYFSNPKLEKPEISVNSNGIYFRLCLTKYIDVKILREHNGVIEVVYNSNAYEDKENFTDVHVEPNEIYSYSYVPYYCDGKNEFCGEEIFISKIKTPTKTVGDDWWLQND